MNKPTRTPSPIDKMGEAIFGRNPQEAFEAGECLHCGAPTDFSKVGDPFQQVNLVLCDPCMKESTDALNAIDGLDSDENVDTDN